jgi:hypothetical protein
MKRDERGKSKQNDRVTFQVVENASAAHGREAILGMDDVSSVGVNKKKQEFSYNSYTEFLHTHHAARCVDKGRRYRSLPYIT